MDGTEQVERTEGRQKFGGEQAEEHRWKEQRRGNRLEGNRVERTGGENRVEDVDWRVIG